MHGFIGPAELQLIAKRVNRDAHPLFEQADVLILRPEEGNLHPRVIDFILHFNYFFCCCQKKLSPFLLNYLKKL